MQPTTPTLLSIVNQSEKVTDAEVAHATPAFGKQVARDYAPVWGATCAIESIPKGHAANGNAFAFVSDTPDVDGALGYHDIDRDGSVTGVVGACYVKVFVVEGYDWRTTMSHEILEMLGDAPANRWRDGADGDDYAEEMCDAVEGDTYEIDGVPVSNFVYPAFFNPCANAADKLDHLGKLKHPFGMTKDGYQIKRTEPGKVSQIFARHMDDGHDVHVAVHAPQSKNGRTILVVFGADVPEENKKGKLAKVQRKYAKAA